jgi:hypothetical protein
MKVAVWIAFGLLAAAWTGGAMLSAELIEWAAAALAAGGTAEPAWSAAQWPMPGWLAPWVDLAWIEAARHALASWLAAAAGSLPLLGSALGWMLPVVWAVWGLGVVLMAVLAGAAHLLLTQARRPMRLRVA